jgi:hypothetical protein
MFGKDFVALPKNGDLRRLGRLGVAVSALGGVAVTRTTVQETEYCACHHEAGTLLHRMHFH